MYSQKWNCAASLFSKQNNNVLSPNSYTHISIRDLYISRIFLSILLQKNMWTAAQYLERNTSMGFSLQCTYNKRLIVKRQPRSHNPYMPKWHRESLCEWPFNRRAMSVHGGPGADGGQADQPDGWLHHPHTEHWTQAQGDKVTILYYQNNVIPTLESLKKNNKIFCMFEQILQSFGRIHC